MINHSSPLTSRPPSSLSTWWPLYSGVHGNEHVGVASRSAGNNYKRQRQKVIGHMIMRGRG